MGVVSKKVFPTVSELGLSKFGEFAEQCLSQNSFDSARLILLGLEADFVLLRVHSFERGCYFFVKTKRGMKLQKC